MDMIFASIVEAPLEYFLKRFDEIIRDKFPNKVMAMFDIYETFQTCFPKFSSVFGKYPIENSHISRIANLVELVASASRRAIVDYRDQVFSTFGQFFILRF